MGKILEHVLRSYTEKITANFLTIRMNFNQCGTVRESAVPNGTDCNRAKRGIKICHIKYSIRCAKYGTQLFKVRDSCSKYGTQTYRTQLFKVRNTIVQSTGLSC